MNNTNKSIDHHPPPPSLSDAEENQRNDNLFSNRSSSDLNPINENTTTEELKESDVPQEIPGNHHVVPPRFGKPTLPSHSYYRTSSGYAGAWGHSHPYFHTQSYGFHPPSIKQHRDDFSCLQQPYHPSSSTLHADTYLYPSSEYAAPPSSHHHPPGPSMDAAVPNPHLYSGSWHPFTSSTTSRACSASQREVINPEILHIADQLNLPMDGYKFSVNNWKSAMTLMYRWKTMTDEVEEQVFGDSTSTNSSLAYGSSKSVKAFCDKVLCRESKRRQFSIHWKESGLKRLVEQYHEEEGPSYDDPMLQVILEDYFSGRKRKTGYKAAKEKALAERQKDIVDVWKQITKGVKGLTLEHLSVLQEWIERPISKTVDVVFAGRKMTHTVTIDGFDGRTIIHTEDDSLSDPKNVPKQGPVEHEARNGSSGENLETSAAAQDNKRRPIEASERLVDHHSTKVRRREETRDKENFLFRNGTSV